MAQGTATGSTPFFLAMSISFYFIFRLALAMSTVPLMSEEMPVPEPPPVTAMAMLALTSLYASAQFAEVYGEHGTTEDWKQLGVEFDGCGSGEIIRVSRQNNSGTYVYFKEAVLGKKRDYKLGSRDMHGSKDVVDLVEHTPCAIGYSGLAYATDDVKLVAVGAMRTGPPRGVLATSES